MQALSQTAIGKFISNINEMKNGMRTTKMTGQEEAEKERISKSAQSIRTYSYKLMRTHALTPPVIDLSSAFVYMLVVGGGGYMAPFTSLIWMAPQLLPLFRPCYCLRSCENSTVFYATSGFNYNIDSICSILTLNWKIQIQI